jgi:hypothetical protein
MKRATVTIPDDVEKALESYVRDQEAPPTFTVVMQAALRQFSAQRGYLQPRGPLQITPAKRGSGYTDISEEHARYFMG